MGDPAPTQRRRLSAPRRRSALLALGGAVVVIAVVVLTTSAPLTHGPEVVAPSGPPTTTAGSATPSPSTQLVPWNELDARWGTYVPEREWGTPREAVGTDGWGLGYANATSSEYRYGEDGIAGVSDRDGDTVISWAFWDGRRGRVTERLFGVSNPQGDHGESIVDDRVLLENTPTHSYARQVLQYGGTAPADARYSVQLEMAKVDSRTLLLRATSTLTSSAAAPLHLVMRVRNTVAGPEDAAITPVPQGLLVRGANPVAIVGAEPFDGWQADRDKGALDANLRAGRLSGTGSGPYGALDTLLELSPSAASIVTVAVAEAPDRSSVDTTITAASAALGDADAVITERRAEADRLFASDVSEHGALYQAALWSLLGSESTYRWDGVSTALPRWTGRVDAHDVLIMPDKWEYPYPAAWDSAFHAVTASLIDPELGADQLRFLLSDRWQQPDGHVPCAEWVMELECPPVLAWAAWRVHEAGARSGFLETVYPGLQRQYRYWTSSLQVEPDLYGGGFLGMDDLPRAKRQAQADGSAWMASFAGWMARIADELGEADAAASFRSDRDRIGAAVNARLWNEATGLYHDLDDTGRGFIVLPSYVAFIPLIAGIVPPDRQSRLLDALRDEARFLGPAGVRSVSKVNAAYLPGYAGHGVNSNWLGPVWLPIDYLLVEALRPIDPLLADEIRERTVTAVEADWRASGGRFHEYFDGDTGAGLGADEQTGWTALVANLIAEGWPRSGRAALPPRDAVDGAAEAHQVHLPRLVLAERCDRVAALQQHARRSRAGEGIAGRDPPDGAGAVVGVEVDARQCRGG